MFFTDTQKISKTAYDALKRIRESRNKATADLVLESKSFTKSRYNTIFPEYSDDKFKEKIDLDGYIYNKLLENLEDGEKESVSKLISEMLTDVKEIYKFINVEPKIVGFKNMDVSDNRNSLLIEATNVINNFLNKEYYSLSKDERYRKYKDSVVNFAHNIVLEEGVDPQEAIEHSYKTAVIQRLLEDINFPFVIKHKINEVFEDDLYNDFFNVEELHDLKESFDIKAKNIARVISVLIK